MISKSIKKPSKKAQREKADAIARKACHERGYCEASGKDNVRCGGGIQWAHIIGRSNYRLRWSQRNCLALCAGHHVWYTHHPWEWQELIRSAFPNQYEYINTHRNELWDGNYPTTVID